MFKKLKLIKKIIFTDSITPKTVKEVRIFLKIQISVGSVQRPLHSIFISFWSIN